MNKFIRWFGLLCAVEMCTLCAHAQERELARAAMDAFGKDLPANAGKILSKGVETAVERQILNGLTRQAAQIQAGVDVNRALLKMEPAFVKNTPAEGKFQANAFLIETKNKGQREVWGVTAAELLQGFGKEVVLSTNVDGKEISFSAQAVVKGPFAISNIALLRVPQDLPEGLKPLSLSRTYDFEQPVSLFGYKKGDLFALQNIKLQKDNGLFMRMDFSDVRLNESGPYGGPVLSQGKLVGVYCKRSFSGGYASSVRALPYLLEEARGVKTEFPLQMHHILFGYIYPTEVILKVEALDAGGKSVGSKRVYKELHQSEVFKLFNKPNARYLRFLLEDRKNDPGAFSPKNQFRILTYDKVQQIGWVHPIDFPGQQVPISE